MASGLTLIFGVMRVINIAHGAFIILAAFVTYSLWKAADIDPLLTIVVTTPLMFAIGWVVYVLAVRRIRGAHMSSSVLLTFALALVLEGLMGIIWGNTSHSVRPDYFNQSFTIGDIFLPKAQVYGFVVAAAVLAALWLILMRTWLGRAIRASAVNPSGAALVGVNVGAVAALTFAVGVGGDRRRRLDRQRAVSVPAGVALRVDRARAQHHRAGRARQPAGRGPRRADPGRGGGHDPDLHLARHGPAPCPTW